MLFDSAGWTLLTSLLPFVLLFGFWIFLMRRVQGKPTQDQTLEKLEEIRQELERLRRAIESRP